MNNVALVIIFNHNYEANIDRLLEIYSSRFKHIWFVIPFYTGRRDDVITVYENSFYFQGYIASAISQLKKLCFNHYFFIADDLYLNPAINETNYVSYFQVDFETSFLPEFFLLNDLKATKPYRPFAPFWGHDKSAINLKISQRGIEVANLLPSYDEALILLKKHGLLFSPKMNSKMFYSNPLFKKMSTKNDLFKNLERLNLLLNNFKYILKGAQIPYPLVGSYSDICIVPQGYIAKFELYCGIFASLNLFVEIALPTALAFSATKIITEPDLKLKGETYWRKEGINDCEKKYQNSLDYLNKNFPPNTLYVHPIKLSRWKAAN